VDDGDKPVSISTEVEDYIPINIVGIHKHAADISEIEPPYSFDYSCPSSDFICRVSIAVNGFLDMPPSDDIHAAP
jgi:hypothetical protein